MPVVRAEFRIAALLLAIGSGISHAAGLGPIDVQSALGQAFQANIAVIGSDAKDQGANCVKARLESLDGAVSIVPAITMMRAGQAASIRLTSRESINEPVLNVQVNLGCDVSVQRAYQILL
ncbi:MAG: hypothetical protein H7315_12245, partial [Herminiimonas sp.]|nr:hypothetical protein [Herminiimonas sp.]